MSELSLYELTDSELDAVAAGQGLGNIGQGGLANIAVQLTDVLNNVNVSVLDNNQILITNVLNNNTVQVGVGAAVAILSGAANGLVRQLG